MGAPNESAEDYLEAILLLSKKSGSVRAIDIANHFGYKKSSVSVAMKNLREKQLITVSDQNLIELTAEGKKMAKNVYERHEWFTNWLVSLGIDEVTAANDACKIEHVISNETFDAIRKNITNIK